MRKSFLSRLLLPDVHNFSSPLTRDWQQTTYIFVTFIIVNNKNFHLEMSIFDCIEDFTKLNKKIQQRKELYCLSGFKLFNSCNQNFFLGNICRFHNNSDFLWNGMSRRKVGLVLGAAIWSSSKIFLQFEFATDKSGEFCKRASEGKNFPGFNFLARAGSHLQSICHHVHFFFSGSLPLSFKVLPQRAAGAELYMSPLHSDIFWF